MIDEPDTDEDEDGFDEQTIRDLTSEALAAHEAALAMWSGQKTQPSMPAVVVPPAPEEEPPGGDPDTSA